ncbi:MAG: DUF2029 domain-containing protein [Nevskia sp.]|nr:DUF2029 domain-containing protein [Nevskia sp.]
MSATDAQPDTPLTVPVRLLCGLLLACSVLLFGLYLNFVLRHGPPLGDFFVLWAAAGQALHAPLATVYDPAAFAAWKQAYTQGPLQHYPFLYPPHTALLLLPLARLPYAPALLCWNLLSLALYLAGVWRLLRPRRWLPLAALVAPATVGCLLSGQVGLLCGGLALLGFGALPQRPLAAGVLLGLLVLKPQFALLPLLLLPAAGRYRASLAAGATLALLFAASVAAFGLEAWSAWLQHLGAFSSGISSSAAHQEFGVTVYFTLLSLGLSSHPALAAQALAALAVLWLSARALRAGASPMHLAVPMVGLFLATPYAVAYDLPLTAAVCLLLFAAGRRGGLRYGELPVIAAAWWLPGVVMFSDLPLHAVALCLLLLLFTLVLRRCMRSSEIKNPA